MLFSEFIPLSYHLVYTLSILDEEVLPFEKASPSSHNTIKLNTSNIMFHK